LHQADGPLTSDELAGFSALFEGLTFDQRIERLGLRPDRADVIVPACRVIASVLGRAGISTLHIPYVGVKEGLLLEMSEQLFP
jgi:exopolyphosphatase/guanosine-5'-triphosphate,3'-diphosphate pyrophosphatase